MPGRKKSHFHIPKLDLSCFDEPLTDEGCNKAVAETEQDSNHEDLLKFVERMETHPKSLSSWDMDIPFDEFARRVRAGEYK